MNLVLPYHSFQLSQEPFDQLIQVESLHALLVLVEVVKPTIASLTRPSQLIPVRWNAGPLLSLRCLSPTAAIYPSFLLEEA